MKIYTKTGDKGMTGLIGGERRRKDDLLFEAIGTIDELNSFVGVARSVGFTKDALLQDVQNALFDLGSSLADPQHLIAFESAALVTRFEGDIDDMNEQLEPLRNFILPGGSPASAALHVCRSVCRRAERAVIRLELESGEPVVFLNRLSDWLFVSARFANHNESTADILWNSR
ncbi:MAG: cob(I)yrinic acid a,c-diamide adenosyltransferase [Fimbriimonadaceae bacterium]